MTTILDAFSAAVAKHGPKPAIIDGNGAKTTFDELELRAQSAAAGFAARGIGRGDRVLMAMPVGPDLYVCLAALWRLGACVVFPEPAMGLKGLRFAARVAKPKAYLASGWYSCLGAVVPELLRLDMRLKPEPASDEAPPPLNVDKDETALISFTSGSTGAPKAIARSHAFMMAQCKAIAPLLEPESNDERDLVAFPVFVLVCLALGVTAVLPHWKLSRHNTVSADAICEQMARDRVTRLLAPPAICETLSKARSLPSIKAVFTGGGPVFPDTILRLKSLRQNLRVVAVYGSTEAEPIAHLEFDDVSSADLERMRSGGGLLAGRPVDAIDIRLEEGEILVAGDHVNESYLDPAMDAETKIRCDGRIWHRTGDRGRFDEAGRLWLLGRTKARIGGVDPFSIETAARFWPGAERSALANQNGQPVLVIQGDASRLSEWEQSAVRLGVDHVRSIRKIPLDRRHRSKTDLGKLQKILKRAR